MRNINTRMRFRTKNDVRFAANNTRKARVETTERPGHEYPWLVRVKYLTGYTAMREFKRLEDAKTFVSDVGAL